MTIMERIKTVGRLEQCHNDLEKDFKNTSESLRLEMKELKVLWTHNREENTSLQKELESEKAHLTALFALNENCPGNIERC